MRGLRTRRFGGAVAVSAALGAVAGCAGPGHGEDTLTVLAAASLTEPFTALAEEFENRHQGVDVVTGFDSSATLAAQVAAGAPADVVATADPRTMQTMVDAAVLAGPPTVFARNHLALVVPPDNPGGVAGLADLQDADFVVCAPAVPCGALAATLLDDAGVTARPRSLEVDVKAVLTKVLLDEVDAGLVYASDVEAAGDRVREVPLPGPSRLSTDYPVAVTSDSERPALAEAFVRLVLSPEGQQILDDAGFAASVTGRRDDGQQP